MEQGISSKAKSYSVGQEIPCLLYNPNVRLNNGLYPEFIPVPPSISLSSSLRLGHPRDLFHSGSPCISHLTRATYSVHFILQLIILNNIWCRVQIMKLLIMQIPPVSPNFLPLRSIYSQGKIQKLHYDKSYGTKFCSETHLSIRITAFSDSVHHLVF
jgi:hypothetical protein